MALSARASLHEKLLVIILMEVVKRPMPLTIARSTTKAVPHQRRKERAIMALEQEMETYRRELPKLLADEGKFVLIHGTQVLGVFPDRGSALETGYQGVGLDTAFLVKQIQKKEPVYVVPSVFRCQP